MTSEEENEIDVFNNILCGLKSSDHEVRIATEETFIVVHPQQILQSLVKHASSFPEDPSLRSTIYDFIQAAIYKAEKRKQIYNETIEECQIVFIKLLFMEDNPSCFDDFVAAITALCSYLNTKQEGITWDDVEEKLVNMLFSELTLQIELALMIIIESNFMFIPLVLNNFEQIFPILENILNEIMMNPCIGIRAIKLIAIVLEKSLSDVSDSCYQLVPRIIRITESMALSSHGEALLETLLDTVEVCPKMYQFTIGTFISILLKIMDEGSQVIVEDCLNIIVALVERLYEEFEKEALHYLADIVKYALILCSQMEQAELNRWLLTIGDDSQIDREHIPLAVAGENAIIKLSNVVDPEIYFTVLYEAIYQSVSYNKWKLNNASIVACSILMELKPQVHGTYRNSFEKVLLYHTESKNPMIIYSLIKVFEQRIKLFDLTYRSDFGKIICSFIIKHASNSPFTKIRLRALQALTTICKEINSQEFEYKNFTREIFTIVNTRLNDIKCEPFSDLSKIALKICLYVIPELSEKLNDQESNIDVILAQLLILADSYASEESFEQYTRLMKGITKIINFMGYFRNSYFMYRIWNHVESFYTLLQSSEDSVNHTATYFSLVRNIVKASTHIMKFLLADFFPIMLEFLEMHVRDPENFTMMEDTSFKFFGEFKQTQRYLSISDKISVCRLAKKLLNT